MFYDELAQYVKNCASMSLWCIWKSRLVELDKEFDSCYSSCMKKCSWCSAEKQEEDFAFRNKSKGTRRAQCRECIKEWDRKHWVEGKKKETSKEHRQAILSRNRDFIWSVLTSNVCVDCGNNNPLVLEFDHLRDKTADVCSQMRDWSVEKLQAEIDKCEIVCANCHRIRTSNRAGWWRSVQAALA